MLKKERVDTTATIREVHIHTPNVLNMIFAINGIQISQGNTGEAIPPLKRTNPIREIVQINKYVFNIVGNSNEVRNKNKHPTISIAVKNKCKELMV